MPGEIGRRGRMITLSTTCTHAAAIQNRCIEDSDGSCAKQLGGTGGSSRQLPLAHVPSVCPPQPAAQILVGAMGK